MRVLLVEDDAKLAAAVARGLRHEGYAVDHVGDGEAALLQAAVYAYDAVVLDLISRGATAWRSAGRCASAATRRPCWFSPLAGRSTTAFGAWTPGPTTT